MTFQAPPPVPPSCSLNQAQPHLGASVSEEHCSPRYPKESLISKSSFVCDLSQRGPFIPLLTIAILPCHFLAPLSYSKIF